jgi:hypothetical protein
MALIDERLAHHDTRVIHEDVYGALQRERGSGSKDLVGLRQIDLRAFNSETPFPQFRDPGIEGALVYIPQGDATRAPLQDTRGKEGADALSTTGYEDVLVMQLGHGIFPVRLW